MIFSYHSIYLFFKVHLPLQPILYIYISDKKIRYALARICKQIVYTLVTKHYNLKTTKGAKTLMWITQLSYKDFKQSIFLLT